MDRTEILKLIRTIDSRTLAPAKEITKVILNMRGGKWDTLKLSQRVCVLAAVCIKYGEGRGNHGRTEPAKKCADT